jgi:hypothetical protein
MNFGNQASPEIAVFYELPFDPHVGNSKLIDQWHKCPPFQEKAALLEAIVS